MGMTCGQISCIALGKPYEECCGMCKSMGGEVTWEHY